MKLIPLTQGQFATVDDDDFKKLSKFKWYAVKRENTFYAVRNVQVAKGVQRQLRMHRQILGLADYKDYCDHKDGNGLNNQKDNLRACTSSKNQMNSTKRVKASSVFKGVSFHKQRRKWQASIGIDRRFKYLGLFETDIDAARAYDEAAKRLHGEFAKTNF